MKDNQIKVNKICLDLAGQKVELTLEQARELKDVLNSLFKSEITYIPISPINYPPIQPPPIWADNQPFWERWQTWCDSQGTLNCQAKL